jgi:hypothetical protein
MAQLARDEATLVAVDADLVADRRASGSTDQKVLAVVTTRSAPPSPNYGKLVKSAEVIHKYAASQFFQAYPNTNATITGGFVLYGLADSWQKYDAGKIDAVDVTLSLAKAGADITAILGDTGILPINPAIAKGVGAACAAVLLVKEFIDSSEPTERTVVCVLDPEDLERLPGDIEAEVIRPSLGITAAALGSGTLVPASLPWQAACVADAASPLPNSSFTSGQTEPVEQLLRRAASRIPPNGD